MALRPDRAGRAVIGGGFAQRRDPTARLPVDGQFRPASVRVAVVRPDRGAVSAVGTAHTSGRSRRCAAAVAHFLPGQ